MRNTSSTCLKYEYGSLKSTKQLMPRKLFFTCSSPFKSISPALCTCMKNLIIIEAKGKTRRVVYFLYFYSIIFFCIINQTVHYALVFLCKSIMMRIFHIVVFWALCIQHILIYCTVVLYTIHINMQCMHYASVCESSLQTKLI